MEIIKKDGKAVVEPEDRPERILQRMETLVAEAASENGDATPLGEVAADEARAAGDQYIHCRNGDGSV